jgi:hypothetical protein
VSYSAVTGMGERSSFGIGASGVGQVRVQAS